MTCVEPSICIGLHPSSHFLNSERGSKRVKALVSKLHCHPYILHPVPYNLNWHCVTTPCTVIEYCSVVVSILGFHVGGHWFESKSKPDILTGFSCFSLHICIILCFNIDNGYFLPLFILNHPTIYELTLLMPNSRSLYDCGIAFVIMGSRLHSFCLGPNFFTVNSARTAILQYSVHLSERFVHSTGRVNMQYNFLNITQSSNLD